MNTQAPYKKRPTLGLLIDWVDGDYQRALLGGIDQAVRKADVNLLCFAGGVLDSDVRQSRQRNHVYDLVDRSNVDALLVLSGTVANQVGPAGLRTRLEHLAPMPMVSIALKLDGIPSVLVDNKSGVREALEHLIDAHNVTRIACIKGPSENPEANSRFEAYQEVLHNRGLPLSEHWVVEGDFQPRSGVQAVAELFDGSQPPPQAILSTNDAMALTALGELARRGIDVPGDVALVGFDDIEESRLNSPPITTVAQPLHRQGQVAVELALRALDGETALPDEVLPTELILRRSCGCHGTNAPEYRPAERRSAAQDNTESLEAHLRQLLGTAAAELPDAWLTELQTGFEEELAKPASRRFTLTLERCVERTLAINPSPAPWTQVLAHLQHRWQGSLPLDPAVRERAAQLFHNAQLLVARAAERAQAHARLALDALARRSGEVGTALIRSFSLEALAQAVFEHFPSLGIPSGAIALYEGSERPAKRSQLVLAYHGESRQSSGTPMPTFATTELFPPSLAQSHERYSRVIEPLFFDHDALGFVVLSLRPGLSLVYGSIDQQLSVALRGALLVEEVTRTNEQRLNLLRDVAERNRELEEAYETLQTNQKQLLAFEKMASLGRLTASIAHEMNTPLAAVRTAMSDLGDLVREYSDSAGDPEVTAGDHKEIAAEMHKAIDIATNAAGKAASFVRGVKTQTRDLGPKERVAFDPVLVAEEALLLLSRALKTAQVRVELSPPATPVRLVGSPGRLAQVLTNLVNNAADASQGSDAPIRIAFDKKPGELELSVADGGTGIPREHLSKIFESSFTTKPFGKGTGLGLAIVQDVIVSEFGGQVLVESEPERGTTFILKLPTGAHG